MTRNVKKLLQSTKLPLETRRFLPVFTVGDEIIWLPGFPVSDRFRPCGDQVAELWFFSEKILTAAERNNIINGKEEYQG